MGVRRIALVSRRPRPADPRQLPLLPDPRRPRDCGSADANDSPMQQAADNAGPGFVDLAKTYVLGYLVTHRRASGEVLTDACKAAGIVPANDDRAFGAVFASLSKAKAIRAIGTVPRRKGHGTAGAIVWELSA